MRPQDPYLNRIQLRPSQYFADIDCNFAIGLLGDGHSQVLQQKLQA